MQTTAIRTVASSLPQNEVILLTLLISKGYIPYTDLLKNFDPQAELSYFFLTLPRYIPKPYSYDEITAHGGGPRGRRGDTDRLQRHETDKTHALSPDGAHRRDR